MQNVPVQVNDTQMIPSRAVTNGDDSVIPLRVDYITPNPMESQGTLYCTDIEGTQLRVGVQESISADLDHEIDGWYRFDGIVRSQSLRAELRLSGNGSIERIETPEKDTQPLLADLNDPTLIQMDSSAEVIGMTIQPRSASMTASVGATDPEGVEIGAVCLVHCDGTGETTVYHREEAHPQDEHLLLQHVVEKISGVERVTLVTHDHNNSQIEMLYDRVALAAEGEIIDSGAERVLDDCFHVTTEQVAIRTGADTVIQAARQMNIDVSSVLLDNYDIGIEQTDWRDDWEALPETLPSASVPRMTDQDYEVLLERYFDDESSSGDSAELARCLKAYASADLELIRGLIAQGVMDRLACSRVAGCVPRRD